MQTRSFSLAIGVIYLVWGVLGLIPALYTSPPPGAPHLEVTSGYGYLFGQLPVNVIADLARIAIGLAGVACGASLNASITYSRFLFLFFGTLTFLGFFPQGDTLFGYAPIFGTDAFLHAATALVASYFGWVANAETSMPLAEEHAH